MATLHVAIACVCSRSGGAAQVSAVAADINAHALYEGVRTGGKGDLCNQVAARAAKNPTWFTKNKQARRWLMSRRLATECGNLGASAQRPGELTLTPVGAAALAAALSKLRAAGEAAALDAYLQLGPPTTAAAPPVPQQPPPAPAPPQQPFVARPPWTLPPAPADEAEPRNEGAAKRIKLEAPSAQVAPPAAVTHVGDGERLAVALLLGDTSRAAGAPRAALDAAEASLRAALAALQTARDAAA